MGLGGVGGVGRCLGVGRFLQCDDLDPDNVLNTQHAG